MSFASGENGVHASRIMINLHSFVVSPMKPEATDDHVNVSEVKIFRLEYVGFFNCDQALLLFL